MARIEGLDAREILDSRGRPTVEAICRLAGGAMGSASVPSGRSTGSSEALELRDGDPRRYRGLGCLRAVANIRGEIAAGLAGVDFPDQGALDRRLIELDGTANKGRLGANALLAVSIAFARAQAEAASLPLYRHFASIIELPPAAGPARHAPRGGAARGATPVARPAADPLASAALPRLTINLFSGGMHAGSQVSIQDVLVVPLAPDTVDGSLVMMYDIYQTAAEIALDRFGMRLLTADEGGLAPPFAGSEAMIAAGVEAIERAGYRPGIDAALAVDVAASHFYEGEASTAAGERHGRSRGEATGRYRIDGRVFSPREMIALLVGWVDRYPILSLEDGLAEEDWEHWPLLLREVDGRALVVGDDLLCTNPARIRRAAAEAACDALLLKVNQIGTLTEAGSALRIAREAGWQVTVSVRSGETEDSWAADLAVGLQGDQFKNGSITQSERLAKYNRLLAIELESGFRVRSWRK